MSGVRRPLGALGLGLVLAAGVSSVGGQQIVDDIERRPLGLSVVHESADTHKIWEAEVVPAGAYLRAELVVDGKSVPGRQHLDAPFRTEELTPGHHHLEVRETYRGGRVVRVRDAVVTGPFEQVPPPASSCDIGVQVTGRAVDELVVPVLSSKLLEAVRTVDVLGPQTELERAELTLGTGQISFKVALASHNRLIVHGRIRVRSDLPRQVVLELENLDKVAFTGSLRQKVDVGAATVGALVTGPFAPIGAIAGYYLADHYVEKRAREEVTLQIERGLQRVTELAVVPETAELVPGESRTRVQLSFCRDLEVDSERGVTAHMRIVPDEVSPASVGIPGPIAIDGELPRLPAGGEVALRVDVSLMFLNRLMYAWTSIGLLADWVGEGGAVERINRVLAEWTTLQIQGFYGRYPPHFDRAEAGSPYPWRVALSGLVLEVEGTRTGPKQVVLAARGSLAPTLAGPTGPLGLGGHLQGLWVGCEEVEPSGRRRVTTCIGSLLENTDVREQLNARLQPGAGHLPTVDVQALVVHQTQELEPSFKLDRLWIEPVAEAPNVIRVEASLRSNAE